MYTRLDIIPVAKLDILPRSSSTKWDIFLFTLPFDLVRYSPTFPPCNQVRYSFTLPFNHCNILLHVTSSDQTLFCPVSWGCRIYRLQLCTGVRPPPPNECPGYDTKQSDGEVTVMLELWGMRSTPLLPSLAGPLWPGVVVPDKDPIYGLNRTKPCFLHYTDSC